MSDHENGWDKHAVKLRKVHETYIAVFLLAAIVLALTLSWYDNPHLAELISFSATIASLILAVLAIGYAVYSGTGFERSMGQVILAAQQTQVINKDARDSFAEMKEELESLRKEVSNSQQYLEKIGAKTLGDSKSGAVDPSEPVANTEYSATSTSFGPMHLERPTPAVPVVERPGDAEEVETGEAK